MSKSQRAEADGNHTLGSGVETEANAVDVFESGSEPDAIPEVDATDDTESGEEITEPEGDGNASESRNETPSYSQQYSFNFDAEDAEEALEPSEESVELDLAAFGADVDHHERESEIAQPEASSFGVDDRKTVTRGDGGEQHALFADTNEDQQTLTGESAANQCMFGNGGGSQ